MKQISFLLCLIFLLALAGCGYSNRQADLSSDCYKLGVEILELTDDYLDGDITAIVAAGELQNLCRQIDGVPDEVGSKNRDVQKYCGILRYGISLRANGEEYDANELLYARNYLASLLGYPSRSK